MIEMKMEKEAEIDTTWLTVSNYQFKILVMIACLAQEGLAFRGKLADMCIFLGVSNSKPNTDKIKEAIANLEKKEDIIVVKDGYTWTLTLTVKAERKDKIKRIKNAWIAAIKEYKPEEEKDSVSWESILKVLVYLIADKREIKRYDEIGKALGITEKTVQRAVKALSNIDFKDIELKKKLAWFKNKNDEFKVNGQRLEVAYKFDD